jgi:hypothetical protein
MKELQPPEQMNSGLESLPLITHSEVTSYRLVEICYQFRENSCLYLYTNIRFISQVCCLFNNVKKKISWNSTSPKLEARLYLHFILETTNHRTFSRLIFFVYNSNKLFYISAKLGHFNFNLDETRIWFLPF